MVVTTKRFSIYFCIDKVFLLEWMAVCVNHMISIFKTTVLTRTQSFLVHISVQSVSDSLFLTEKVQKPIVSLWSSEEYLFIDIEYVGVITEGSTHKINSEMLPTAGIQCICGVMAQWTVKPDLLTYSKCWCFQRSIIYDILTGWSCLGD